MRRHKKYAFQMVVFCIIVGYCISVVNKILIPKYFYNAGWATTSTYIDFYNMKKGSIDVLFLGSSHCVAAFMPTELYERYGIRSYNLGSEQQNLLLSYYWLREALRFQKPQYVFLDTFMLFPYDESAPLNSSEAIMRKSIDFMKWSEVKVKAIMDICEIDKGQTLSSYFFPTERFHTRWKMLSEDDFQVEAMSQHETLMGFRPLNFACEDDTYQPFSQDAEVEYAEMIPVMQGYLDRIVALCAENDIRLVLTKSPTMYYSQEAYYAVSAYAFENHLEYIDFNEENVYRAAGLDFAMDSCDTDHVNLSGAIKMSDYIGEWLSGKVPCDYVDEQWEKRARYYQHYLKDESLKTEADLCRYLPMLADNRYSAFLVVMGDASGLFSPRTLEALGSLGLAPQLAETPGGSYYAIIDAQKILKEEAGEGALEHRGTIRNGLVKYSVMSAGTAAGNDCLIDINGGEVSLRHDGLNIVVYCNDEKKIIDRVCFYVENGETKCIR